MRHTFLLPIVLLAAVATSPTLRAEPATSPLITPTQANRYGLQRAWFTQLRLAAGRGGIIDLQLHVSSTSAQTVFRVVSQQGPTYTFSDRNVDIFGQPLGEDGAGKAAAEKVRLLRLRGIESKIERVVIPDITVYATTGAGVVHAIDAETGRPRWITSVGIIRYPTTKPAITESHVALVNGQTLYVIDAKTGKIATERRVVGGPGAGPTIVGGSVYVPMLNGRLTAYEFAPDAPWWPAITYYSAGSIFVQPTAAGERVVWANSEGDISVATTGRPGVQRRLELKEPIAGPLIYVPPEQILGVTASGDVYSFNIANGQLLWRFASGDATTQPAAVVDDRVFLMTRGAGIYAISASTGESVWPSAYQPGRKFVAATENRVYCVSYLGQMAVLDVKTGHRIGDVPLNLTDLAFANNQTDRIYIATRDGVLQCLHELGVDVPIVHLHADDQEKDQDVKGKAKPGSDAAAPKKETPDAKVDENPFGDS